MAGIETGSRVRVVKVLPFDDLGNQSERALKRLGQEGDVISVLPDSDSGYGIGVRFETLDEDGCRNLFFYGEELEVIA